jgi:hypothetical protein
MTSRMPPLRAALVALAVGIAGPAAGAGRDVIEDDWPRALAVAKERGVPILVDVWAPW